jgi:uncharacterized protein (UPF0332 family)
MNNDSYKKDLAKAKMEKALEAWDEALWCYKGGKYPATVNRLYYAMYRACLAVLAFETRIPTKHTAVIGQVNQKYVKEGILPREIGKFLHNIQTARVESDYKAKDFTREDVEDFIKQGDIVLQKLKTLIEVLIKEYIDE